MSSECKKEKMKRNFISLESKIHILNRISNGEKVSHIARSLNLNEATVRTIKKSEDKIRSAVEAGSSLSRNMTGRPRAPIMLKMEKELNIWMEDCNEKKIPVGSHIIKQKALEIYNQLKENGENPSIPDFIASTGWFERFKSRFQLRNIKLGDKDSETTTYTSTYSKPRFKLLDDMTSEDVEELLVEIEFSDANLTESTDTKNSSEEEIDENNLKHENTNETSNFNSTKSILESLIKEENESLIKDENESQNEEENKYVPDFTLNSIREGFDVAEQLESYFLMHDPCVERSAKFKRELQQCLAPYQQIYKELLNNNQDAEDIIENGDIIHRKKHKK